MISGEVDPIEHPERIIYKKFNLLSNRKYWKRGIKTKTHGYSNRNDCIIINVYKKRELFLNSINTSIAYKYYHHPIQTGTYIFPHSWGWGRTTHFQKIQVKEKKGTIPHEDSFKIWDQLESALFSYHCIME